MSTSDFVDTLIYGENFEVLRRFLTDETVDLIYLDPPFSRNAAYNVIFRDESGRKSDAQLMSFEDYWHWGPTAERHYAYLTNAELHRGRVNHATSALVGALHESMRPSPLLAYLVEMAVRLGELQRVLKSTGSLYLHCDPTASHYLKLLMDAAFGPTNFRSEIVWKRGHAHNTARGYGASHDVLLFYSKSDAFIWNPVYQRYDERYLARHYRHVDEHGRRYKHENPTGAGVSRGVTGQPWRGIDPTLKGRHWSVRPEEMDRLDAAGRIHWPRKPGAWPYIKLYLDERKGIPAQDVWTDIDPINMVAKERLGYPTQKPVALLRRIIIASSNPGDLVLDPFCGCGTAIEAAIGTDRHWIGIDHSNDAVKVIRDRIRGLDVPLDVFDWPTELDGVRRMVEAPGGRHRFEAWALTRLNAQPVRELGGVGPDQGIDGRISFTLPNGRVENIIVSVKSGHTGSAALRDLKGTVQRERAAMGLLFTLQEPTEPMRREAVTAGFYRAPSGETYPKAVIFTVRELFEGRLPSLPIKQGVQVSMWPQLPTISRPVRLRPTRTAQAPSPQVTPPSPPTWRRPSARPSRSRLVEQGGDLLARPNVVAHAGCHRRGDVPPKAPMGPREVVMHVMEGNRRGMVGDLL